MKFPVFPRQGTAFSRHWLSIAPLLLTAALSLSAAAGCAGAAGYQDPYGGLFAAEPEGVVGIIVDEAKRITGQGAIISESGEVLTAFHVVRRHHRVQIYYQGREYPATVSETSLADDLAVLKFDPESPPRPLKLAARGPHAKGARLTAYFLDLKTRELRSDPGVVREFAEGRIFFDATIAHGHSGAPMLNENGELAAVFKGIRSKNGQVRYAIPIERFQRRRSTFSRFGLMQHYVLPATEVVINGDGDFQVYGLKRSYSLNAEGALDIYSLATWHYQINGPLIPPLEYYIEVVDRHGNRVDGFAPRKAMIGGRQNGHNSIQKWRLEVKPGCYDFVVYTRKRESARETFCVYQQGAEGSEEPDEEGEE